MTAKPFDANCILDTYREQLLRWNHQINLVSRKDTEQRIDSLIRQSRAGFELSLAHGRALFGDEEIPRPIWYFDLGSGGGLPGFVWHCLLTEAGLAPATTLVEPRLKRAWFLERLSRTPDVVPFRVLNCRWDEVPEGETPDFQAGDHHGGLILISLKALRLADSEVLFGLTRTLPDWAQGEFRLLIARYYPPGTTMSREICDELGIPAEGFRIDLEPWSITKVGHGVEETTARGDAAASLVFSEYSLFRA